MNPLKVSKHEIELWKVKDAVKYAVPFKDASPYRLSDLLEALEGPSDAADQLYEIERASQYEQRDWTPEEEKLVNKYRKKLERDVKRAKVSLVQVLEDEGIEIK